MQFRTRLVALGYALLHLVDGVVANYRKAMLSEIVGDAVDALRLLEGDELIAVCFNLRRQKYKIISDSPTFKQKNVQMCKLHTFFLRVGEKEVK